MAASAATAAAAAAKHVPIRMVPVPAASLHVSRPTHWLTSRFHFSFASHQYAEPNRNQFGRLLVFNDDQVIARSGFGTHPHRDMEILSYILKGELSHQDSMGSKESLGRGCAQYMSAGRGVRHSEMNDHPTETTRFLQIWVLPDHRGVAPRYGSREFTREQRHNQLLHMVQPLSSLGDDDEALRGDARRCSIGLDADVNFYVSELDVGKSVEFALKEGRMIYLVNAEGTLRVTGSKNARAGGGDGDGATLETESLVLGHGDAVEINQDSKTHSALQLTFTAEPAASGSAQQHDASGVKSPVAAHFLFIEMARRDPVHARGY